jgi:hypothetical protein
MPALFLFSKTYFTISGPLGNHTKANDVNIVTDFFMPVSYG